MADRRENDEQQRATGESHDDYRSDIDSSGSTGRQRAKSNDTADEATGSTTRSLLRHFRRSAAAQVSRSIGSVRDPAAIDPAKESAGPTEAAGTAASQLDESIANAIGPNLRTADCESDPESPEIPAG